MKIEVIDAVKKFSDHVVLKQVNMVMENGMINGVVGRNGSGKTVLMKCICGFLRLDSGMIRVNDQIIGKDVDMLDDVGMIIENPGFLPNYTGYKNLEFLYGINHPKNKKCIMDAMTQVGLDPHLKRHVGKYSLGMRQRLGIAQAIMEDPKILILDEPMNGLDHHGVEDIRKLLLGLKEKGKNILIASHNREDIDILCDHVWEMDQGVLKEMR